MTSYVAIKKQIAKLEAQAAALRNQEAAKVIASIRQHVIDFGLTPDDIFPNLRVSAKTKKATKPLAPKYRDPKTGATWSGRGKPPAWMSPAIKSDTRAQYLITQKVETPPVKPSKPKAKLPPVQVRKPAKKQAVKPAEKSVRPKTTPRASKAPAKPLTTKKPAPAKAQKAEAK